MESLTHTRGGLHFLLPTLGSAGDVFPLMELGIALQQRGHHATIVANEFFADPIRGSGLGFIGLGTRQERAVIRSLSDLLPDGSLHFVETALDPVFRAGFHISPLALASSGCGLPSFFEGCHFCNLQASFWSVQN